MKSKLCPYKKHCHSAGDCETCDYEKVYKRCKRKIARQQAEIERLTNENAILSINADNAFQEGLNENRQLFKNEVEAEIKSEARKEFAERLKEKMYIKKDKLYYSVIIDNLLKELDGKENSDENNSKH